MNLPGNASAKSPSAKGISRRAFTVGAASAIGSLFLEPVFGKENTFWLPGANVEQAYADETATITVSPGQFSVACYGPQVSLDSLGIPAIKLNRAPVAGVTVRVKSLYNGKEAEAKSNENGIASFDLGQLACKQHSDDVGDFWEFDASITIDPAGSQTFKDCRLNGTQLVFNWYTPNYRQVVIPRIHIMAGDAIQAPMVDIDSKPYFRSISFDDWDIQYNQQEFVISSSNDATHSFAAELYFPSATKYAVRPVVSKSDHAERVGCSLATAQVVEGAAGEFKAIKFDGAKYLCGNGTEGGNNNVVSALREGEVVSLVISDPSKSGDKATLYTVQTGLSAYQAPCSDGAKQDSGNISPITSDDGSYGEKSVSLASSNGGGARSSDNDDQATTHSAGGAGLKSIPNPTFHLPFDNMPDKLKNLSVSCWAPSFPIVFRYDPAGFIMFGLDFELFNYSNAPDVYTGDTSWRSQPRRTLRDQCDRKQQLFKNRINEWKQMKAASLAGGKKLAHQSFGEVSFSGSFQLIAQLVYDNSKKLWTGDLSTVIGASVAGSFTVQFNWMGFPFYVKIELWASLSFGAAWGLESAPATTDSASLISSLSAILSGINFVPNSRTLAFTLQIGAAATLAAGVDGLAGAGVRGSGGISFSWQWRANAKTDFAGKSDPRLLIGAHVEIALFAEVFGLRASWTCWSGAWPSLYDSDKSSNARAAFAANDDESSTIEPDCSCLQPGGEYYIPGNDGIAVSSLYDAATGAIDFSKFVLVTSSELGNVAEIIASATASDAAVAMLAATDGEDASANANDTVGNSVVVNDFTPETLSANAESIVSVALSANSGEESENDIISLAASNDTYGYEWTDGHGYEYKNRGSAGDVIWKLGDRGGVLPCRMDLLAKDVFSAAHSKLININGARYLFRIAPVKYGEDVRMRLVYQRITDTEASKPVPVEYDTTGASANRKDLYDYNFDVRIVGGKSGSSRVLLLVISGKRPEGDNTTIFQAAEATIASTVMLEHRGVQTAADQGDFATKGSMSWESPAYESTKKYYAFRSPKLMVRDSNSDAAFDRVGSDGFDHDFGFFIVERSDSREDLLTPGKGDSGICVIHFAFNGDRYDAMDIVNMGIPSGTVSLTPDSLQNAPSDANAVFATFGCKSHEGCSIRSLKLGFEKVNDGRNTLKSVQAVPVIDVDSSVKSICPWDEKDTLIAVVSDGEGNADGSDTGYFARVALPTVGEIESHLGATSAFSEFSMTCVSPKDVPLSGLSMRASHKYCYYATNHSGVKGYEFDEDGAYKTNEDGSYKSYVDDPSYLIKAFAEVNGVFTKSFIFAQCDNPVDSFFAVEDTTGDSSSKTSFVVRHVTSAADSKANLYAFDVPFLRSVSVDAAGPVSLEVVPGESNAFTVTVTNSGNTVLTQVKLKFIDDESGKTIGEATLDFDKAKNSSNDGLDEDAYAQDKMASDDKSNILVADNGDAALVPGQTRSFVVDIDIPESWTGTKKKLTVRAESTDMSYIDPNTGKEEFSGTGIALYDADASTSTTIEVAVASDAESELALAELSGEVVPYGSDGGSNGGGDGNGDGSGGGNGGSGSVLPMTGDGPFAPAVAAVTAAAAGFAAYSARRTRLEQQRESGEPDEE